MSSRLTVLMIVILAFGVLTGLALADVVGASARRFEREPGIE